MPVFTFRNDTGTLYRTVLFSPMHQGRFVLMTPIVHERPVQQTGRICGGQRPKVHTQCVPIPKAHAEDLYICRMQDVTVRNLITGLGVCGGGEGFSLFRGAHRHTNARFSVLYKRGRAGCSIRRILRLIGVKDDCGLAPAERDRARQRTPHIKRGWVLDAVLNRCASK